MSIRRSLTLFVVAALASVTGAACNDGDGPPPPEDHEHTIPAIVSNPNNYDLSTLRPHLGWDTPDGVQLDALLERTDVDADDRFTMVLDGVEPPPASLRDGFATGMFKLIDPRDAQQQSATTDLVGNGVVAPYDGGTLLGFGVDVFVLYTDDPAQVQELVDIDALQPGLNVLVVDPNVRDCEERKAFEHERCIEDVAPNCAEEIDAVACESRACGDGDQIVEECGFGFALAGADLLVRFEMLSVPEAAPAPAPAP